MPIEPLVLDRFRSEPRTRPPRTIAQRRRRAEQADAKAWKELGLPLPEADVQEHLVTVAEWPDVRIRLHRPVGVEEPLPVLITFFGGAFRQGGIDFRFNQWAHRARARDAGVVVLAVDYALAPEHRAPTQLEQGLAVLDWVVDHGAEHGIDPTRIALGGQSSGGNLAACVVNENLVRRRHPVALQILEVPALDLSTKSFSFEVLKEVRLPKFLARREYRSIARDYLGKGKPSTDPRYSPLHREDLSEVPPTVLMLSEFDVLRGDGVAYHTRLREAGVDSSAMIAVGQTHDSNAAVGALLSARHWHVSVVGCLRTLHTPLTR
ncbi:alpha/beta hydrolase [Propionibacteriaceae bacterium Y1700]|uniref:alpha/beta hydrolase n=1 Tax=Microlunatus sp. Y1700 TaxID=3418487 RepID=UPI003DA773DF